MAYPDSCESTSSTATRPQLATKQFNLRRSKIPLHRHDAEKRGARVHCLYCTGITRKINPLSIQPKAHILISDVKCLQALTQHAAKQVSAQGIGNCSWPSYHMLHEQPTPRFLQMRFVPFRCLCILPHPAHCLTISLSSITTRVLLCLFIDSLRFPGVLSKPVIQND